MLDQEDPEAGDRPDFVTSSNQPLGGSSNSNGQINSWARYNEAGGQEVHAAATSSTNQGLPGFDFAAMARVEAMAVKARQDAMPGARPAFSGAEPASIWHPLGGGDVKDELNGANVPSAAGNISFQFSPAAQSVFSNASDLHSNVQQERSHGRSDIAQNNISLQPGGAALDAEADTADWIMQMIQKPTSPPAMAQMKSFQTPNYYGYLPSAGTPPAYPQFDSRSPLEQAGRTFSPSQFGSGLSGEDYSFGHFFPEKTSSTDGANLSPVQVLQPEKTNHSNLYATPTRPTQSSSAHGSLGLRVTTTGLNSHYQLALPQSQTGHWREPTTSDLSPISPSGNSLSPMTAHSPFSYSPGTSDMPHSPDHGGHLPDIEQSRSPLPISPYSGLSDGYDQGGEIDYLGDFQKLMSNMPGLARSTSFQEGSQSSHAQNQQNHTKLQQSLQGGILPETLDTMSVDGARSRETLQGLLRHVEALAQMAPAPANPSSAIGSSTITRSNSWSGPMAISDRERIQQRLQTERKISALCAAGIDPSSNLGQAYLVSSNSAMHAQTGVPHQTWDEGASGLSLNRQQLKPEFTQPADWHNGSPVKMTRHNSKGRETIPIPAINAPELLVQPSTPTFSAMSEENLNSGDPFVSSLHSSSTGNHLLNSGQSNQEVRRASLQHTIYQNSEQHWSSQPSTHVAPSIMIDDRAAEDVHQADAKRARIGGSRNQRALSDSFMPRMVINPNEGDNAPGSSSHARLVSEVPRPRTNDPTSPTRPYLGSMHHRGRSDSVSSRHSNFRKRSSVSPHGKHRQVASEDLDRIKTEQFLAEITGLDGGLAPPSRHRAGYQELIEPHPPAFAETTSPLASSSRHAYSQSVPNLSTQQAAEVGSLGDFHMTPHLSTGKEQRPQSMTFEPMSHAKLDLSSSQSFDDRSQPFLTLQRASSYSAMAPSKPSPARHGYPSMSSDFSSPSATSADLSSLTKSGKILPIPAVANPTTAATQAASESRRKTSAQFTCPFPGCDSTFTRQYNLRGHLRSHMDERPFVCDWPSCDKSFARAHDCKRHQQLHYGFRPYLCTCNRNFARLDALNRHLKVDAEPGCQRANLPQGRIASDDSGGLRYP